MHSTRAIVIAGACYRDAAWGSGDRGAQPSAAVLDVDVDLADLGRVTVTLKLGEGHRRATCVYGKGLRMTTQRDLASGLQRGEIVTGEVFVK